MIDSNVPEDMGIWSMLLIEWESCLIDLDRQLLKLEVEFEDQELIDGLISSIHRIKRGASYAGWTVIMSVAHGMEAALVRFREKALEVHPELIDVMLSAAEMLRDCVGELGRSLKHPGPMVEGVDRSGEWSLATEACGAWEEVVRKLHEVGASKGRPEVAESAGAAEETGISQPADLNQVKEQFLYEVYEHLDTVSECLIRLDQEGGHPEGTVNLMATMRRIAASAHEYGSILPEDHATHATVGEAGHMAQLFAHLLEGLRAKGRMPGKDVLSLGHELADYWRGALESVALESGASGMNDVLLDKLQRAIEELASIRTASTGGADAEAAPGAASGREASPEPAHKAAALPQSIRVSQDKLDKMMNMISELLIAKNGFMHLSKKLNMEVDLPKELSKEVKEVGFSINRISDELQNAIMSMRMVEVKTVFQKMPKIVRDVAQLTGKKIELVMVGESTEIDKTIVEIISDPIVHLIRNAADHGIEPSEERLRKGKSEHGRITLRAYKDKHVYIEIEDDGKGIDAEVIRRKAIERGFVSADQAEKMTKNQIMNLIFLPGFSTAGQITEVSGRGVGMDIVKSNIEKINGSVSIDSDIDRGTKMVIHLPLTIAISRGLVVDVAGETYIFPIDHISETVKVSAKDIHEFKGKYYASHKGNVIGIEWLSRLLLLGDRNLREDEEFNAVIVVSGAEKFGLIVDRLRNEQEFVIKPLSGQLAKIPGISGSTLLGDGQVVLIINPLDLIQMAKS